MNQLPKPVASEISADANTDLRAPNLRIARQSLDAAASQLTQGGFSVASILSRGERKQVRQRLADARLQKTTELAIQHVRVSAQTMVMAIQHETEQRVFATLKAHNEATEHLHKQSTSLASEALNQQVAADQRYQTMVASSKCSDADKQLLSIVLRQITENTMHRIAGQHVVFPTARDQEHARAPHNMAGHVADGLVGEPPLPPDEEMS
jgi:hypothetical protein